MTNKFLHWSPRLLSLLFLIFLSLFALDVFNEYQGWAALPALLTHLLLPLVLLLATIAAWKWDLVGVITFFAFAIYYVIMVGFDRHWSWYVSISGPAIIIGALFLSNWIKNKKI